jgi:hypothetical protein
MSNELANNPTQNLEVYHKNNVLVNDNEKVYGEITLGKLKQQELSPLNKEILLARFSEKQIKDLDANYVGERVKRAINLAVFTVGYKVENLSDLILLLVKDIFMDFKFMTISEIELAFRLGSRGKLGEIMGLSLRTFYNWLDAYKEYKQEAIGSLMQIKEKPKEMTYEQKKESYTKWLKSYVENFDKYKKKEQIELFDIGNVFYDFCEKYGIAYLSTEEKNELYERAKDIVKNNYNRDNAKSTIQANEFAEIINSIKLNRYNDDIKNKIIAEAKRLAILKIFDKLIEQNIELSDIIEEKKDYLFDAL